MAGPRPSVRIPYLRRYLDGGDKTLGFSRYMVDFVPFEDANVPPTDSQPLGDTRHHPTLMIRANTTDVFVCMAFGEIGEIISTDRRSGFWIRLRCPARASCAAHYAYIMQLETLQQIVDDDELSTGSIPGTSWFLPAEAARGSPPEYGSFYVHIASASLQQLDSILDVLQIGQLVKLKVSIHRRRIGSNSMNTGGFLSSARKPVELDTYNREFGAIRVRTSIDGTGDVFGYYAIQSSTPYFFPRRNGKAMPIFYKMTFSGCVQTAYLSTDFHGRAVTMTTITLPPNPNIAAELLFFKQLDFMQQISDADIAFTQSCGAQPRWGAVGNSFATPAIVVGLFHPGRPGRPAGPAVVGEHLSVGDDITFTSYLTRQDEESLLSYLLVGTVDRVLRPDQLRLPDSIHRFPGCCYGFLYATQSIKRRRVAVPYNYGVDKLTSVNDLFVHVWVPRPTSSRSLVDLSVGRLTLNHFPGTDVPLEFSYSIIYVPPSSPVNSEANVCSILRGPDEWRGNVLVVKHGKRKAVINMEREDTFLVDNLVNACINLGLLV
ncbi:hypothetical protein C8R43DRAFT_1125643 [Mycena crocata]|nr:hypothetical protein C8R43DRAFT_1125643 [Mycena crocata]